MKKITIIVCSFAALSIPAAYFMAGCSDNNPNRIPTASWVNGPSSGDPTPLSTPAPFTTPQTTPQPMVPLGSAANYVVLAYTEITNGGSSTLCGSLGVFPGALVDTGIQMNCGGTQDVGTSNAGTAQTDLNMAYSDAAGRAGGALLPSGADVGGQTLYPGLYTDNGDLSVVIGDLILDAQGASNSVFLFQVNGNLNVASGRKVLLAHGASAANVFWQVAGQASMGATIVFDGNIMAHSSVLFGTGTVLTGRVLSENGTVSLLADTLTHP